VTLSAFDIFLVLLVVVVIVKVTLTGFVTEFFSRAAVIVGALGAVLFYKRLSPVIVHLYAAAVFPDVIAFLLIFLIGYLAVKLVQQLAGSVIQGDSLNNLDHALGFFLGIVEGVLFVAVLLFAIRTQTFFDVSFLTRDSLFARFFDSFLTETPALPFIREGISGFLPVP
jgi:membrane protein required for colicin V production